MDGIRGNCSVGRTVGARPRTLFVVIASFCKGNPLRVLEKECAMIRDLKLEGFIAEVCEWRPVKPPCLHCSLHPECMLCSWPCL